MAMRDAFRRAGLQVPSEPDRREEVTTQANCISCGKTFEPRQPTHRLCNDCNRQQSGSTSPSGRRQDDQRRPDNRPRGGALPEFPKSYFNNDDDGQPYLLPAFVSKDVDALANHLAGGNLTTGQARRFFNHCRKIERRLNFGESWEQVSASFELLRVHAQNANSARKIPRDFHRFIDDNVSRVTSEDDREKAFLEGFLPHFEALIGYGSAHMKDR